MCESSVFLVRGSRRELVMDEVAKVIVEGKKVVCVNALGERRTLEGSEIAEANLLKHEILLRPAVG